MKCVPRTSTPSALVVRDCGPRGGWRSQRCGRRGRFGAERAPEGPWGQAERPRWRRERRSSKYAIRFVPMGWSSAAGHTYSVAVTGAAPAIAYDVHVVSCK